MLAFETVEHIVFGQIPKEAYMLMFLQDENIIRLVDYFDTKKAVKRTKQAQVPLQAYPEALLSFDPHGKMKPSFFNRMIHKVMGMLHFVSEGQSFSMHLARSSGSGRRYYLLNLGCLTFQTADRKVPNSLTYQQTGRAIAEILN